MPVRRGLIIVPQQTLRNFLQVHLPQAPGVKRLAVGLSGGLDSTVLLHVLHSIAREFALPLRAVHVHHGLSPNADAWAAAVEKQCATLQVPLEVRRVQVADGPSREAEARNARYAAFAASLVADEALLLAQHRDDQAETLLFRLLRGAGVTGLGAMRHNSWLRIAPQLAVPQWRPFLTLPRTALLAYAEAQQLQWIEDESNLDLHHDRNFLRHDVLPRLQARWPAVSATLAATARRLQEADLLLQEFAADLAVGSIDTDNHLSVAALKQMSLPRQKLLLRYWLQQQGFLPPDEAVLNRISAEVVPAPEDAMPLVAWPGAELRRYRDHLYVMKPLPVIPEGWECRWSGKEPLQLPDGRHLLLDGYAGVEQQWVIRYRRGGERFRPAPGRPSRELRTLLQESGIPPWQRDRLPLVFAGDELIAIAGLVLSDGPDALRFQVVEAR
jgi:tRNA(Ile)-lysidine synthase